jgi:hypothetical protein
MKRESQDSKRRQAYNLATQTLWLSNLPSCKLPKSCVADVGTVGFLFLAEMNEKETDLHQRMTEAVSLHKEVG